MWSGQWDYERKNKNNNVLENRLTVNPYTPYTRQNSPYRKWKGTWTEHELINMEKVISSVHTHGTPNIHTYANMHAHKHTQMQKRFQH